MGFISWGRCHSEVIQQKWVDFFSQILETITCQKISRKKNTFNSALTTYQTNKCCGLHLKKKSTYSSQQLLLKETSYSILRNHETCWNPDWLQMYMPTVLCISFLFHNDTSITINKLKKWITIPDCFRNGNLSYNSLEL